MAINRTQVESLLQGLSRIDPRLYDTLKAMLLYIDTKDTEVLLTATTPAATALGIPVLAPANFNYTLPGDQLRLSWDVSIGAVNYEIRVGESWVDSSSVLLTNTLAANLNPVASGTYVYWIAAIDGSGVYSDKISLTIVINNPSVVIATPLVIDNNVLLYWALPATSSFNIAYYRLYQDGVFSGNIYGTFTTVFVSLFGDYTFGIVAVDLAGNAGPDSPVLVNVNQPPDFEIKATQVSTFTGTKTNCIVENSGLYAPIIDETYEDHFIDNSWTTIQGQLDAGYPLYIQPGNITAEYVEDFDFSAPFDAAVVRISYSVEQFGVDDVAIVTELQTSTDGAVWSVVTTDLTLLGYNVQYARVTFTFIGASDKSICCVRNLRCILDVTYGVDSGAIDTVSTDVGGTIVTFNLPFRDVNSISLALNDTTAGYVVFDFTDVVDPTHFHAFSFDTAGVRTSKNVSWKARGIV